MSGLSRSKDLPPPYFGGAPASLSDVGVRTSLCRRLVVSLVISAAIAVLLTALVAFGLFRLNANKRAEADLRKQAAALGRELQIRIDRDAQLAGGGSRTGPGGQAPPGQPGQGPGAPGQERPGGGEPQPRNTAAPREPELPPMPLQVVRAAGRLDAASVWAAGRDGAWHLARSDGNRDFDAAFVNAMNFDAEGSASGNYRSRGRRPMNFAAQRIQTDRGSFLVLLGQEARIGDAFLGGARFLIGAAIAIAISVLIALWLAQRLNRPLNEMAAATGAMSRGDFSHRVRIPREIELARLALSINSMGEQIADSRARERSLLMNVSHDLRTPLTAIRGYAEALSDGALPDKDAERHAADVIITESGRLERLVRDLLDLARLDAGEFALEFSEVDLADLLTGVGEVWQGRAESAGLAWRLDVRDSLSVITDGDRVVQVIGNLLENALRHTPEGGQVSIELESASAGAWIRVTDTGEGIPPEDLPHIFDRLYVGRSAEVRTSGTGLGLAIVNQLITALGGSIEAISEPNVGTSFTVWLPPTAPAGGSTVADTA